MAQTDPVAKNGLQGPSKRPGCFKGRGNNPVDKLIFRISDGVTIATGGGVSMLVCAAPSAHRQMHSKHTAAVYVCACATD